MQLSQAPICKKYRQHNGDQRERSRQAFPMGKSCLKIHQNAGRAYTRFSRGFSILIHPSGRPVGNVPVDLWSPTSMQLQNIFTQFRPILLSQLNFTVRTSVSFLNENYNIGIDGNAFERYNFGYTFPNDDRSIKRIHFRRMKMTFQK